MTTSPDIQINAFMGDQDASVWVQHPDYPFPIANAMASRCGTSEWFVNRVFVSEEWRRKRIGSEVVSKLKELVKSKGAERLLVAPGGYDMATKFQRAFYRSLGFSTSDHTIGVMVCDFMEEGESVTENSESGSPA